MGSWTIPNVDSALVERLSALPDEERAALERDVVGVLEQRVGGARMSARARDSARIRAMTPKDVVQTDSVILIREDRDR